MALRQISSQPIPPDFVYASLHVGFLESGLAVIHRSCSLVPLTHNQGWLSLEIAQPERSSNTDMRGAHGSGGSIRPALVLLFPEKHQRWAALSDGFQL